MDGFLPGSEDMEMDRNEWSNPPVDSILGERRFLVSREAVREAHYGHRRKTSQDRYPVNTRSFGKKLTKLCGGIKLGLDRSILVTTHTEDGPSSEPKMTRVYGFPPLAECRKSFEGVLGHPVEWNDVKGYGDNY